MKCLCCNTKMVSVNDYHSCGYPMTIYACPKCESGAEVVTDDDGFITTCIFNKYKKFNIIAWLPLPKPYERVKSHVNRN